MPRATCRCGQPLSVPKDGTDRLVCPQCGAKIRVRRPPSAVVAAGLADDDGFIRFPCLCGRRLKVAAPDGRLAPTAQCRCPDCGKLVDVPEHSKVSDPEAPTSELSAAEMAQLEVWAKKFDSKPGAAPSTHELLAPTPWKSEAGMRVCPQCGKPIHLGAA